MSRDVSGKPAAGPANESDRRPAHESETRPTPVPGIGRWITLALVLIILDQASKLYFETAYAYGQRVNVLPIFDFTLMYNRGAAFSFLASEAGWQRWLFTALGIVASVVIVWLLRRNTAQPRFCLALALILGGALGNVIDRVAHGHVIDFLLFYWKDWYYPAFNIADVGITCGAVLLVLDELLRARQSRKAS